MNKSDCDIDVALEVKKLTSESLSLLRKLTEENAIPPFHAEEQRESATNFRRLIDHAITESNKIIRDACCSKILWSATKQATTLRNFASTVSG